MLTIDGLAWRLTAGDALGLRRVRTFSDVALSFVFKGIRDASVLRDDERAKHDTALEVQQALMEFLASDALEPSVALFRQRPGDKATRARAAPPQRVDRQLTLPQVVSVVRHLWSQMLRPDGVPGMTHGGCVKALQLHLDQCLEAHPELVAWDTVVLDEAHDASDVTFDVIMRLVREHGKSAIVIGDVHQRIYTRLIGSNIIHIGPE